MSRNRMMTEAEIRSASWARQEQLKKLTDDRFIQWAEQLFVQSEQICDDNEEVVLAVALTAELNSRDSAGLGSWRLLSAEFQQKRRRFTELHLRVAEWYLCKDTWSWAVRLMHSTAGSLHTSDVKTDWRYLCEIVNLLCHLVSRWAFQTGGTELRDPLHDRVTRYLLNKVACGRQVDKEKREELIRWLNQYVDSRDRWYGECTQFTGSEGQAWPSRDDNLFGRFAGIVTEIVQHQEDPIARLAVAASAVTFMTDGDTHRDIQGIYRTATEIQSHNPSRGIREFL